MGLQSQVYERRGVSRRLGRAHLGPGRGVAFPNTVFAAQEGLHREVA